jgi:hypothetical protein
MPVTIKVNGTCLSLVHKMSNGISTATIPDVCKTPSPGGPVPVPYPNIAQSITLSNGTTTVKGDKAMAANKGSKFAMSNGDQAGTVGGVKSNVFMKEATWILYSFDVKMDGKNACRLTDKMFHNAENCANLTGELQGVATAAFADQIGAKDMADKLCDAACGAKKDKAAADAADRAAGRTPRSSYQRFMRNRLDPKPRGSTPGILTETSQKIGGDFIGKWGTTTAGGAPFVRWDVVLTGLKATVGRGAVLFTDLMKIVEVKFPGDTLTPNQQNMLDTMSKKDLQKIVKMDVDKDCDCK